MRVPPSFSVTTLLIDHLPDQVHPCVVRAVEVGVVSGVLNGQNPGLVQADVAHGFTFTGEVELLLFLALVFGHDDMLFSRWGWLGQRGGANVAWVSDFAGGGQQGRRRQG